MSKCYAWYNADNDGAGATGCSTKEEALVAFRKLFLDDSYEMAERTAKIEDIEEKTLYKHRRCDIGTIGDSDACYECGEPHLSKGRRIFYINFDK